MPSATLLLFNFSPDKAGILRETAAALGVKTREVRPDEHKKPLTALLAGPAGPLSAPAAPAFSEEMLVMAGFDRALIDRFLDRIRPLTPGVLKAAATAYNLFWTGETLARELLEERQRLRG